MPYIGRFVGMAMAIALFSGSVAAQDIEAMLPSLAGSKHLTAHRAKVAWNIHRNVVPVASRLAPTSGATEDSAPAAITTISSTSSEAQAATRP